MKPNQKSSLKTAQNHYDQMEFSLAIQVLEKLPHTFRNQLFLARCYDQQALITPDPSQKKNYQLKGISLCQKLLTNHLNSVALYLNLGNIYHHLALDQPTHNPQAIKHFKIALSLSTKKSERIESLNSIGNSYQRMGKLSAALKYYSQGYRISPAKSVAILFNLSFIYLKLGRWQKCLEISHRYLKLASKLPDTKLQRMFRNSILKNIQATQNHLNFPTNQVAL